MTFITNCRTAAAVVVCGIFFGGVVSPCTTMASDSFVVDDRPEEVGKCSGLLYRAKKDGVPVYQEADTSSAVVLRLESGEEVCYVGEQGDFAVLHWRYREKSSADDGSQLAYARLVDLWSSEQYQSEKASRSRARKPKSLFDTVRGYYHYIRSGGVPEDGLAPYRPIINKFKVQQPQQPDGSQSCSSPCDSKESGESSGP